MNKTKKAMAVGLSILAMMTNNLSVFAAEPDNKTTTLTYQVNSSYDWTIHSSIDFGTDAGANQTVDRNGNQVKVLKNVIPAGKRLRIKVKGTGENNAFALSNGKTQTLPYDVSDDNGSVGVNGSVLNVPAGVNTATQNMNFKLHTKTGSAEVAGSYDGNVVYNSEVVDAGNEVMSDGTIGVNMYVDLPQEALADENSYLQITDADNKVSTKKIHEMNVLGNEVMVPVPVSAHEMTGAITVDVYANNNKIKSISTTLKDVAEKTIAESTSKLEIDYLKTMLNYGGYTQVIANKNTDNLAYTSVKDELQQKMDNVTVDSVSEYKFVTTENQEGVSLYGGATTQGSTFGINCYFKVDSSTDLSTLPTKVDDKTCAIQKYSTLYYLNISSIKTNKLDEFHTFAIGDTTVNYSVLSYAYSSLKNATNEKGMLVSKSEYLFWRAAKAYLG